MKIKPHSNNIGIKIFMILTLIIVVAIVSWLRVFVFEPQYKLGIKQYNVEQYEECIKTFSNIKGFEDSNIYIYKAKYNITENYFKNGEYDKVNESYKDLIDYLIEQQRDEYR